VLRLLVLAALGLSAAAIAGAPARALPVPWCGSGEPTADVPDAVEAFEWHVVYATPSDGVDRFASYAPRIAGDVAESSDWWVGQDQTRRPRFDLVDSPGCGSEYGRVDISLVRTRPGTESFEDVVADVNAAGFASPDKSYLVYFDGAAQGSLCGESTISSEVAAYAVIFLQGCNQASNDDLRAVIAAHEMTHGMGSVAGQAPHSCPGSHVCDSSSDLMKPFFGQSDSLATLTLDVGRDDYYGHSGTWPDVRDSSLLYRLDQSLAPAPDIVGLTATSVGDVARIRWNVSAQQDGLGYRIYDEQGHVVTAFQRSPVVVERLGLRSLVVLTVRAENPGGFLGPADTIRFEVGYGIVDAAGALVQDTVPPDPVRHLRESISHGRLALRWPAVADLIGLRGYRVSAPGVPPLLVRAATARLPLARVRGKLVSVGAVDRAGNLGRVARLRVPH